MAQAEGAKAIITFDEESTYGTDPGTVSSFDLPFVTESLRMTQRFVKRNTIQSNRNEKDPRLGNKDVLGDITVELNNHNHTYFLKHLLGALATTGASAPYTHTIKVGSLPVGLVIEKGFTDIAQYFKYNGCKINGATFNCPSEGIVTATFNIIGSGKETVAGTSMDGTPTSDDDFVYDSFQCALTEGGSAIATVTELSFSVQNNLDGAAGYAIGGSGLRTQLPAGTVLVSGSLASFFENVTLYNKAKNKTESSLVLTMTKDASNSIVIEVPELIYEPAAPVVDGPRGLFVRLNFQGYYDNGADASSIKIVVKNDMATIA